MNDGSFDCDVVIIGYGFSGVFVVNIFGVNGVCVVVFECWMDIYQCVWVVMMNDWMLCCFQLVGLVDVLKVGMDEMYLL